MAGFTEYNLPIAIANHIVALLNYIVTDSDIVKYYFCVRTKTTCILNQAIKKDLQKNLIDQMKESCLSICTGGSNNQILEKMNSVAVKIFSINQAQRCH